MVAYVNAWILLLYMMASGSVLLTALAWLARERVWAVIHALGAVGCVVVVEFV